MLYESKLENVTVGADPEVFVATTEGDISSVIGKLGGSKAHPLPVADGALQEDNVLAEFNIRPAKNKIEFMYNMNSVMSSLRKALQNKGLQPVVIPSHVFSKGKLESYGHQAMEFGCSSEWNAWSRKEMPRPNGAKVNLRTAGGHVHVGYDNPCRGSAESLIKMLDFTLGVPSVLIDNDNARRKLYGKAGSMRHKPYGVEYRTLSNFWLNSDELMSWVYDTTLWSTDNLDKLKGYLEVCNPKDVQKAINKSDQGLAWEIVSELEMEIPL